MNIDSFGVDTISFAGGLEAKLVAARAAGFTQIMLLARDLAQHPDGVSAAITAVRASGLRVTGFQVLRDFEGLSGHLHEYKVEVAREMLSMCHALGAKVLLVCSSSSSHASGETEALARDLRKLATLAVPLGIRVAYEALSWGKHINEYQQAWQMVEQVDRANFGLALDSFHMLATASATDLVQEIDPTRIFLVQLADFMWQELPSVEERINTARHFRVFPGEGVHSTTVVKLVQSLDALGYRGDYSFEVFNDDYTQLPATFVAQRALASARWLASQVPRHSLPRRVLA